MLRQFSPLRIVTFFLIDWLGTLGILFLAGVLRSTVGILPQPLIEALRALQIPLYAGEVGTATGILTVPVVVIVAIIWPLFFNVFAVYDGRRNETLKAELVNVFLAVCVSTMVLAGILYFTYRETSRVLFALFFLLDSGLLLGTRIGLSAVRYTQWRRWRSLRRATIVVGAGQVGRNVVEQLCKYAWADVDLAGYVDDDPEKQAQTFDGLPVLGTLDDVEKVVTEYAVQDAVVALPLRAHERLIEVCETLQRLHVHVHVIPDLFALSFPSATLDGFGGIPVIDLGRPSIHGMQRFLKRAFDVLAVSLGITVLSPLLFVVALAIKFTSPGPILYRQQRIGENGRLFTMFKFRSMRVDADPSVHQAHVTHLISRNLSPEGLDGNKSASLKMENDPRVTPFGKWIRKTSFDELPQLFNVLRGEMSLVGPRPPIDYEVALYKDWHKRRFQAIPGITGLWQVKGRNRVSFDEAVRMDLEYIQRQSLWLDIQILLQTPLAMITGKGAG